MQIEGWIIPGLNLPLRVAFRQSADYWRRFASRSADYRLVFAVPCAVQQAGTVLTSPVAVRDFHNSLQRQRLWVQQGLAPYPLALQGLLLRAGPEAIGDRVGAFVGCEIKTPHQEKFSTASV